MEAVKWFCSSVFSSCLESLRSSEGATLSFSFADLLAVETASILFFFLFFGFSSSICLAGGYFHLLSSILEAEVQFFEIGSVSYQVSLDFNRLELGPELLAACFLIGYEIDRHSIG